MPDIFAKKTTHPHKKAASQKRVGFFTTFCEYPAGIRFQSQDSDEIILLYARKHFITNLPWITITLILICVPLIATIILTSLSILSLNFPPMFYWSFMIFYYLCVFSYAFLQFLDWFYNVFILTQKEIVDIDFSSLVYHDVAATNLKLVEDVNYTQTGFIRSFFNYGDVFVQTAGGKENIEAYAIPNPARIAQLVLTFIGKE